MNHKFFLFPSHSPAQLEQRDCCKETEADRTRSKKEKPMKF